MLKTNGFTSRFAKVLLALTLGGGLTSHLKAQGTLTPPGAPAPTMKTLDQVEARTPISSVPFTIAQPGSYYLTGNLTVGSGNAITIATNNVTLDLNGFTLASTAFSHSGSAILASLCRNVSIYNGHIYSSVTNNASGLVFGGIGFVNGIVANNSDNMRVKNVSVSGVSTAGIYLINGNSSVVEACTVTGAGGYGIYAESISDSVASNCGDTAIHGETVMNCKGYGIGNGYGVSATTANNCIGFGSGTGYGVTASTANNCYGNASGSGIGLWGKDVATGCSGNSSSGNGLYTIGTASGCYGFSSSSTGLTAFIANGCRGITVGNVSSLAVTHNVNSF